MPCNYKNYHPDWKTVIRPDIMKRAKNCCEQCGVRHYAVGHRENGRFIPTGGNQWHDMAGNGELSYKESRELCQHHNEICEDKLIIIVLTIAHLDNDTSNNDYSNLKALCQQCHNRLDVEYRKNNRKKI